MNQQTIPNITLFDLLARSWQSRAAISQICFNSDDSLLAIASADGALTLARLADNEPPEARIMIDNGQTTIRPREGRPSPLIKTRVEAASRLARYNGGDILVLTGRGELLRLNRSGEIISKPLADKSPIMTFDHCQKTGLTAVVVPGLLRLQFGEGQPTKEITLTEEPVEIAAISPQGDKVALAATGNLIIRNVTGQAEQLQQVALSDRPLTLQWSPDGKWLACGLLSGGFCLIDIISGRTAMLADFPAAVASLAWSVPENAIFAAGAYRIAGWSMETPPLADSTTGALAAGKAGFVSVSSVAAHPLKPLVASGYPNGRIAVVRIGTSEELVVRDAGGPITALQWSADGRYLAAGDALGSASVITFPEQIFK